jgi:hypothetical protein
MRFFSPLLFAILAATVSAALPAILSAKASATAEALAKAGDVSIVRVFTGWRDAASFKRISEYFDGKENTGGGILLRTQPDQRAGYYFLVRAANSGAPVAVTVSVQMITPTDAKPRTYTFSTALKSGETVLNLGLTGIAWPDAKANPVAWKLDLLSADGQVLATEKSYLWEKPAGS